jgi:hypothetical protein
VVVGDDLADSGASRWRQAVAERGVFAGKDDRGLGPGGGICVLGKHGNEGGQGQSECWDARQEPLRSRQDLAGARLGSRGARDVAGGRRDGMGNAGPAADSGRDGRLIRYIECYIER